MEFIVKRLKDIFVSSRDIPSAKYIIDTYQCNPLLLSNYVQDILDSHSMDASMTILESLGITLYKFEFDDHNTLTFLHVNTTDYKNISNVNYVGTSVCVHKDGTIVKVNCYKLM
jgi:hypothetical protein